MTICVLFIATIGSSYIKQEKNNKEENNELVVIVCSKKQNDANDEQKIAIIICVMMVAWQEIDNCYLCYNKGWHDNNGGMTKTMGTCRALMGK